MEMALPVEKMNPRANIFLMINLGCEMLYVIDQRLKAQEVSANKSKQVIHDIMSVLLETKFLNSLIVGSMQSASQLFSENHCKFMLNDIASCSLIRLNDKSMEKLWNLITMIYKWQLFLTQKPHHLLDITMQHLKSISDLQHINLNKQHVLIIDITKDILLDFWNACTEQQHMSIYETLKSWLECFNMKISLLVRLGFQTLDGHFVEDVPHAYFYEYRNNLGENIYEKSLEIARHMKNDMQRNNYVQQLADVLEIKTSPMAATAIPSPAPPPIQQISSVVCDPILKASLTIERSNEFVPLKIKYSNTNIEKDL